MLMRRLAFACGFALGLLVAISSPAVSAELRRPGVLSGAPGARFLRAPPPGTPVRIRPPASVRDVPAATMPAIAPEPHGWFWEAHSPALSAAGAGRWAEALENVRARRAGGQALFQVETMRTIHAAWGAEVQAAARARNVSEALLLAVIAVESGGQPQARSSKGAQGLMQLIPVTAARFGVADPFDPAANIAGGAAYLDWLLGEFRGDILLTLAAYNAGEAAVRRHAGVPPYPETRDYVVRVMDAVAAAGLLCREAPGGPRIACR